MKNLSRILAICLGLGLVFVLSGIPTTSQSSDNNAALIDKDFGCGLLDQNGFVVAADDGRISVTTSSGNTTLVCKTKGLANDAGKAIHFEGFPCNTWLGLTVNTHETISASGNATLVCMIKHD